MTPSSPVTPDPVTGTGGARDKKAMCDLPEGQCVQCIGYLIAGVVEVLDVAVVFSVSSEDLVGLGE